MRFFQTLITLTGAVIQALSRTAAAGKREGAAGPTSRRLLARHDAPHQDVLGGEEPAAAGSGH